MSQSVSLHLTASSKQASMPNLQHWLNAWVKVNAPQSTSSANGGNVNHSRHSTGTTTGSNKESKLRTSRHHSDRGSSGHTTHSRHGHHNTHSSHSTRAAAASSSGTAAAMSVNGLKKAAASVVAVTDNGRDPHDASFGTATLTTDSLQSTSSGLAAAVGALTEGLHGEPPQRIQSVSESGHSSSDGVAATFDAELAAIRKFNGRKHRRKLNKTNSYSDLVREKAKDVNTSSSSSGKGHNHNSRQNYQSQQNHRRHHHHHHHHRGGGGDGRDHNHFSQTTITTTQFQQHQPPVEEQFPYHHRGTAPPTLYHPPPPSAIAVEGTEGSQVLQHCSCATDEVSVHSNSPTETASTVLRSNQQPQRHIHQQHNDIIHDTSSSYEEGGDHHSHDSSNSAALFGVAEFFGTQIPEDIRRTSRHVFRAQHGVGDEQPHYLRSQEQYFASSSSSQQQQQQSSVVPVPPSHPSSSSSLSTDHNNINRNHIHSRRSNARSSTTVNNIPSSSRISTTTSTTPATRLNQQHSTRYANAAIIPQQPGYPSRYHDSSSHSNNNGVAISSSSSMLVPQQQQQPESLRATRQSSETASVTSANSTTRAADRGLVIGGVRLPFFSNHETSNSNNSNVANHNPIHSQQQQQQQRDHENSPFGGGRANCPGCEAATADLEYMREMVLRKEYTCSSCNSSRETNSTAATNNNASRVHPVLKSTSQQVLGVTERHKKQAEQLMKERVSSVQYCSIGWWKVECFDYGLYWWIWFLTLYPFYHLPTYLWIVIRLN